MIRELGIDNLGVIAHTHLNFGPGLTVLTGETGAGKTLITTAVSQLLGARGDQGLVRHGAEEATIQAVLDAPEDEGLRARLEEIGAVVEDGELVVMRSIGTRSRAALGSRAVAASVLTEIIGESVTLHGQHGQTRLTRPTEQRALLDASDHAVQELLPIVRSAWTHHREVRERLQQAQAQRDAGSREIAEWQALVDSVAEVAPEPGEDAALDTRIAVLSALDAVIRTAREAVTMLTAGDDAQIMDVRTLLGSVRRQLEHRTEAPEFAEWTARVVEAQEAVQALGQDIARFLDRLEGEPDALDTLLARRARIGSLVRRHGMALPELLQQAEEFARRIALAEDPEGTIEHLQSLAEHCAAELESTCTELHGRRVAAATRLAASVTTELHDVGLTHATFEIHLERQHDPAMHGDDLVEFRFSANPGQPPQSLAVVGSGGELSRVMLALETATASSGTSHTFVFDEIDAGVGGRAALEVGQRLAALARVHQVIVVTHLAQVAAFADAHVVVEKRMLPDETVTVTRSLTHDERPRELARMLSGVEDSASATAHASELLDLAASARRQDG